MDAQIADSWFDLYRQNGCKPVLCRGYHPGLNPNHDYKTAKAPITEGFTSKLYTGPTDADIEKHVTAGGWVGWVLPEGVLVLDYDDGPEDEAVIESSFLRAGIEPGIMRTNNGKQAIFKDPGRISGIEQYCKAGPLVCYRIGGKNQCIWPPINGRACEVWVDFNDLPALPGELYPANGFEDHLRALSYQIGKKYRQGVIQGNDDLDLSFMAYLVGLNLPRPEALQSFSEIFGDQYDERRTASLYDRAVERTKDGEPLRGAGSFIQAVKSRGLDEIAGIATKIDRLQKGTEGKKAEPEKDSMTFTTLGELFREEDENVSYVVHEMLPSGGFSILAGKPKGGKTTLARNLALCVARGRDFLGRTVVKGPVLYLALEEKRSEVKKHFQDMGATGEEEIYIFASSAPVDALNQIRKKAEQLKPVLIIIDPLFRFTRVKDGNDYAQVTQALEPVLMLARDTGAHVLVVHHIGKGDHAGGDSILGSTAIFGSVDTAMILKRGDKYRTIHTIQRYGQDLEETTLQFNSETRTIGIGKTKEEEEIDSAGKAIIEYLQGQEDPVTEAEILEAVEGRKAHKVKALRLLREQEKVTREGKGGKGNPFKYSCSLVPSNMPGTNKQTTEKPCKPLIVNDYSCSRTLPDNNKSLRTTKAENYSCSLVPNIVVGTTKQENDFIPEAEYTVVNEDGELEFFPDSTSAPEFQGAILHYTGQGISRSEAKRLVKEGL